MRFLHNFFKFGFLITIVAVEFLATTSKQIAINEVFWDKTNHILAFFVLYVLLNFGFKLKNLSKILILLAYGIQIEIVQSMLPNRFFSLFDIVADCIGIMFGALFCIFITNLITKRVKNGKSKGSF